MVSIIPGVATTINEMGPKSLSYMSKKQEQKRVVENNHTLAHKIKNVKSSYSLSQKAMQEHQRKYLSENRKQFQKNFSPDPLVKRVHEYENSYENQGTQANISESFNSETSPHHSRIESVRSLNPDVMNSIEVKSKVDHII